MKPQAHFKWRQRNIVLNIAKLRKLISVYDNDTVSFLSQLHSNQSYVRDDSLSPSDCSSTASLDSKDSHEWADEEARRRVMQAADESLAEVTFEDNLFTSVDWEDLITLNQMFIL